MKHSAAGISDWAPMSASRLRDTRWRYAGWCSKKTRLGSRDGRDSRRRPDVVREAVGDGVGGGLHRLPREVGIAGGRLDLAVAEEPGDHGQAFAEGERPGREAVSEVMKPHVLEPGLAADHLPRRVQIGQPRAGPASEECAVKTKRRKNMT